MLQSLCVLLGCHFASGFVQPTGFLLQNRATAGLQSVNRVLFAHDSFPQFQTKFVSRSDVRVSSSSSSLRMALNNAAKIGKLIPGNWKVF